MIRFVKVIVISILASLFWNTVYMFYTAMLIHFAYLTKSGLVNIKVIISRSGSRGQNACVCMCCWWVVRLLTLGYTGTFWPNGESVAKLPATYV